MAPRITVPLFVVCARVSCGKVRQVRTRCQQQRQRFCSPRCAYLGRRRAGGFTKAQMALGGKIRASRARAALIARVAGMTPVDAFRAGYVKGLQAKWRRARQRVAA